MKRFQHNLRLAVNRLISAWQLVVKRGVAHWRMLMYVMVGVLLASAILSGTVIYFDALKDLALKNALGRYDDRSLDILFTNRQLPTSPELYAETSGTLEAEAGYRIGWMARSTYRAGKSPTMFLGTPGREAEAGSDNARTFVAFLPELMDNVSLPAGSVRPLDEGVGAPGGPVEVEALVPADAAAQFGVKVGDRFVAKPTWSERIVNPDGSIGTSDAVLYVTVSGMFERGDNAEFNYLEQQTLQASIGSGFRSLPFYVTQNAFFNVITPAFKNMQVTYHWLSDIDQSKVDATNSSLTVLHIDTMGRNLAGNLLGFSYSTDLDNALRDYDQRIFFSRLPMFVVLAMIALVVLFYVATMSALVVETQRSEVALMRSRGSNSAQIHTVFGLEGATIALVAIVIAPPFAALTIGLLGYTPVFSDLTGGSQLEVGISRTAYLLSALGGLLSFAALMVPAWQAARIGLVQQRQFSARPASKPFYQRYYIDVLLLVVSVLLFRQLTEQGSIVARDQLGQETVDQLLLAVPGLVLIATAMILLRLFPLAMNLVSKVTSAWLPTGLVLSVWQMSREPTHYARLSLLLILTAGLGIFAASFGVTLDRNVTERILFLTGSEIRMDSVRPASGTGPAAEPAEAFSQAPGVTAASAVTRTPGQDVTFDGGTNFELLAVDTDTFVDVVWFRDDFAPRPLPELLRSLKVPNATAITGLRLPDDATSILLRLKADRLQPTVSVNVRLQNGHGQFTDVELGRLNDAEPFTMEKALNEGAIQQFAATRPLHVVSVYVQEATLGQIRPGSVLIDSLGVKRSNGQTVVLDEFDDAARWNLLQTTSEALGDSSRPAGEVLANAPADGTVFFWTTGAPMTPRGIYFGEKPSPLSVLASKAFAEASGHGDGDEFTISISGARVPARIVGTLDLFPTTGGPERRYVVADRAAVKRYVTIGSATGDISQMEVWVDTPATGEDREALIAALFQAPGYTASQVVDRAERLAANDASVDPLVEAGWSALLVIAFGTVLVLSCLGFLVHAYVSFRNRRVHFGLMRTVGLSMGQLMTAIWVEQVLVVAVGLALGTWMGGRLGATIMPFLGHDDWGGRVVPPFAVEVNWQALLVTYGVMMVFFVVVSLGLMVLIRQISLQKALRLGEG
ncbi:MAG: ABC transporter permease [SAR202 cluster bacterium]|nr:ABC transporter permease [SAR202 cluster bacterium]